MKNTKRIISIVLSLLMVFGTTVIAASADDETNYSERWSWGLNEMANMAENGLTTDLAEDGYKVLNRAPIVASNGYGIYGFLSFINEIAVYDKHTYRVVMRYDYSGKNCGTSSWMCANVYVDDDTIDMINADFADGDMLTDFNSKEYTYDPEYGYAYKEATADITMIGHNGSTGDFRIYTCGFWEFRIYKYFVYDITVDPEMKNPILTVNAESFQNWNDDDGKRDPSYYENDVYTLDRGFRVLKGQAVAGAYNNKTALANTREYAVGDYRFNATISADTIDDGTICTVAVKNSAGEIVASKDISKPDLVKTTNEKGDFFNGKTTVEVPFTVTEAGNYTVAILVNDKANVTIQSMVVKAGIDQALIDEAENKIDDIGEVTYPDSREAMEAATAAVEAVINAYGFDATDCISNYSIYEEAYVKWMELVEREAAIAAANAAAAKAVDDRITVLGEITLDKEADVAAVRAAYEGLTDAAKTFVANLGMLEAAEARIAELKEEAAIAEANAAAAKAVDDKIAALGNITLDKETAVAKARAAYEALNADQKALVKNLAVLEAVEKDCENERKAQEVTDAVNALNDIKTLNEENIEKFKADVAAAEEALNNLDEEIKVLMFNLADLEAIIIEANKKIEDYEKQQIVYGDLNGDGKVTTADALIALQASVNKVQLTAEQQKAADVNGEEGITTDDALKILQKAVNKIDLFPVEQ